MEGRLGAQRLGFFVLGGTDAHANHFAIGRLQYFELKAVVGNHFACMWDAPSNLTDQPGDGGCFAVLGTKAEKLGQPIDIHAAWHHVGVLRLLHDFGFVVIIANLTHDLFHHVFNGDNPCDGAILVNHNFQTDILTLHFTQQIAHALGLRHKSDIAFHNARDRTHTRFSIGELHDVMRDDDADNVVDRASI